MCMLSGTISAIVFFYICPHTQKDIPLLQCCIFQNETPIFCLPFRLQADTHNVSTNIMYFGSNKVPVNGILKAQMYKLNETEIKSL